MSSFIPSCGPLYVLYCSEFHLLFTFYLLIERFPFCVSGSSNKALENQSDEAGWSICLIRFSLRLPSLYLYLYLFLYSYLYLFLYLYLYLYMHLYLYLSRRYNLCHIEAVLSRQIKCCHTRIIGEHKHLIPPSHSILTPGRPVT